MPPQQLLLSWKDHNGALVSVFENLLKRNTLVDCTLAADGKYLKAHKMVLSACSSYFELLFSQESEKNPIVILKDVKFQELEAAVHFMYRGEVEVSEDRLAEFLEVADSLQIKGLGCDGKTQDFREKFTSLNGSKTAVPPKEHCNEEDTFLQNENAGENCISLDGDQNSNESSTSHPLHQRERSCSSPIPSTLATASSYSLASASPSCPIKAETDSDGVKVENYQCSSPSVSIFPLGDAVPSDVNTEVKSEPASDAYLDEKSDEIEGDFDDVTMMEDQKDWDDPNRECMGDDHASNEHDPAAVWVQDSGGGGGDQRAPQFASVFIQEHQPRPDSGPGLAAAPVPAPAPAPGPASSDASTRQGGVPGWCAQRGKTTSASRGNRYQCHHCSFSTFAPSLLSRHQLVHTGDKPYKCTVCTFATSHQGNLKVHMRIHTKEKPYKCAVCTFATSRKGSLKVHMRIHTGEKPYKCTVCTYATTQQGHLKMHMRKHTKVKPYKCTICSYATKRQDNLTMHMRIHTGEKPYKCTVCTYATTQQCHLKKHMGKHTGEKPFVGSECRLLQRISLRKTRNILTLNDN